MRIERGSSVRVRGVPGCPMGVVVQDSSDRSLVEFPTREGAERDWYQNDRLEVVHGPIHAPEP